MIFHNLENTPIDIVISRQIPDGEKTELITLTVESGTDLEMISTNAFSAGEDMLIRGTGRWMLVAPGPAR